MIILKTRDQINKMIDAGKALALIHKELSTRVVPGVSSLELDSWVEKYLPKHNLISAQKGYKGFPFVTCAAVNDEICHGYPTKRILKEGDIITIDIVINYKGWLADSAWTYAVGNISKEAQDLMDVTKQSMYVGIDQVKIGNRIGDIGKAIQDFVEPKGYSIVRDFCGHGVGIDIHEDPQVLHYGTKMKGPKIVEGMVFTIEPMINIGDWKCKIDGNGWTARTVDGSLSAQYEHTLAVTKDGIIITTDQDNL